MQLSVSNTNESINLLLICLVIHYVMVGFRHSLLLHYLERLLRWVLHHCNLSNNSTNDRKVTSRHMLTINPLYNINNPPLIHDFVIALIQKLLL